MVFNYMCGICNIGMDLNSKEQHEAGKKHRANLSKRKPNNGHNDLIKTANLSNDNKETLAQESSGNLETAEGIDMKSKEGPEAVADQQGNLEKMPNNEKKETVNKSENKPKQEQKPSGSLVYVQGYPRFATASDISKVLTPFGTLKCERMKPDFAIIKFHDQKAAEAAVTSNKKVILYGSYLSLTHFKPRQVSEKKQNNEMKFTRSKQKEIIVEPKNLSLGADFDQQCFSVMASVRLTFEEVENISRLYQDLQGALQTVWPGCVAVPFGSITTGLGIKTSDADCFIRIPEHQQRYAGNHVSKAKNVLSKYPQIFSEVFSIPRANTPIVKFFHMPTETNCDVSFKTPLGARNSSLLGFLLRSDPRILPLCVLLKYWFKILSLTGTGRLSNYALSILVIFYLQQPPAPILPSVKFLQRGLFFVDSWNTAFIDQHSLLPPTQNSLELKHLLGGFFKFYRAFNFDELVVSPFLGSAVKKNVFEDTANVDEVFALYKHNVANEYVKPLKINSPMCVQDPFELCHNIACTVGPKLHSEITQCIKWAAEIYEKDLPNNCNNFLKKILLEKPKIEKVQSNATVKISLADGILRHLANEGWKEKVNEAFIIIFEQILKFKLKKEDPTQDKATQETGIYKGVATQCLWRQRRATKSAKATNIDCLTKQLKINEEIIALKQPSVNMEVNLKMKFTQLPKRVHIFVKQDSDPQFNTFCMHDVPMLFSELFIMFKAKANSQVNGSMPGTSKNNDEIQMCTEIIESKVNERVGSKPASENRDIPKAKSDSTAHHDSSPENPPSKIFKTE